MLHDDKMRSRRAGIALAVVVILAGAALFVAVRSDSRVVRPRDLLVPRSGTLFGAFVGTPGIPTTATIEAAVQTTESSLGRPLAIDHHFYPWATPFPTAVERWDMDHGRVPMISWHGADTSAIAAGRDDAMIRARADAIRALDAPVFIRWGWEMDGARNQDWVISPAGYIAAWRHIRAIFKAEDAGNAVWVFCPNAVSFDDGRAQRYYPGRADVDWVCADGYNWAPARPGAPWESFATIYRAFYAWASGLGKPVMIGEFGALERAPGEKAAWIADAYRTLRTSMRKVRAAVYFDADKPGPKGSSVDWRVSTSASALAAFADAASVPYFGSGTGGGSG